MVGGVSVLLSGLVAQSQRLAASANNIANVSTTGRLPTADSPATTVYKPLSVTLTTQEMGEVHAHVVEAQNGYTAVYSPSSPYANEQGLIAAPNVDLAQEIVSIIETKIAYQADARGIKAQQKMMDELLNILT